MTEHETATNGASKSKLNGKSRRKAPLRPPPQTPVETASEATTSPSTDASATPADPPEAALGDGTVTTLEDGSVLVQPTQAQLEAALRQQFKNDPAAIRAAAVETFHAMAAVADQIDGGAGAVPPPTAAATPSAAAAAPVPSSFPTPTPPPGMMPFGEAVFRWTPEAWGGKPLYGVLDRSIERVDLETQKPGPVLLVFVLLEPANARNRAGKVVQLPQGARVIVNASTAWGKVVPLAAGPTGRPIVWAAPTGELYETGDGGREYGMTILYDPDPQDPARPRLIDLETVRGVEGEAP